jgi:hypothetical protein
VLVHVRRMLEFCKRELFGPNFRIYQNENVP